jgi:hypothetical protein
MEIKETANKIFSWFNSLGAFVKVVSTVIVIVTWGASLVTLYNNYIIKKHESKVTMEIQQVKDTLTNQSTQNKEILGWMKAIDGKIKSVTDENTITKSSVTTLQGAYYVLDRSYVRTLEKTLKSSEELSKYKDEKIEALQEALKKND